MTTFRERAAEIARAEVYAPLHVRNCRCVIIPITKAQGPTPMKYALKAVPPNPMSDPNRPRTVDTGPYVATFGRRLAIFTYGTLEDARLYDTPEDAFTEMEARGADLRKTHPVNLVGVEVEEPTRHVRRASALLGQRPDGYVLQGRVSGSFYADPNSPPMRDLSEARVYTDLHKVLSLVSRRGGNLLRPVPVTVGVTPGTRTEVPL